MGTKAYSYRMKENFNFYKKGLHLGNIILFREDDHSFLTDNIQFGIGTVMIVKSKKPYSEKGWAMAITSNKIEFEYGSHDNGWIKLTVETVNHDGRNHITMIDSRSDDVSIPEKVQWVIDQLFNLVNDAKSEDEEGV